MSGSIYCDNEATIARAKNKTYNEKSRHIRLRHKIVKQLLDDGIISLDYVRSELNISDPLTKPLERKLVENTSREKTSGEYIEGNGTHVYNKESKMIVTQPM